MEVLLAENIDGCLGGFDGCVELIATRLPGYEDRLFACEGHLLRGACIAALCNLHTPQYVVVLAAHLGPIFKSKIYHIPLLCGKGRLTLRDKR